MSPSIQADMRIYVFTYRRHDLLPRAVNSLLRQTHENWICELHNDDPNDSFPEELVARTNDPRIRYVLHAQNLGAVGSFNLAFQSVCEPYVSILEDDNWWEPDFLATMLRLMEQYPQVSVAWANMWLSQEMGDGTWQRNGSIWPVTTEDEIQEFLPPDARQVCGALHSNGAMLLRVSEATMFTVPQSQPFFRDRTRPGTRLPRFVAAGAPPAGQLCPNPGLDTRRNRRPEHADSGAARTNLSRARQRLRRFPPTNMDRLPRFARP